MSPVVGKAMEATLVVLYIGLVTTTLYGGAVSEYRASAGAEIADRTLADAATEIEEAVPPPVEGGTVRVRTDLPATIAGSAYRVRVDDDVLVLAHPDPRVEATAPLVLPDRVSRVNGNWSSGEAAWIRAETTDEDVEVELE